MSEKKQVGIRIDAELKRQFKEDVKRRRGRWQGVAGEELENAIREYITGGEEAPEIDGSVDLETRLARIEAAVGVEATDGGTDTSTGQIHAPAPSDRPDPTATTEKKISWLAQCVETELPDEFGEVPRWKLKDVVADEYSFKDETTAKYVDHLIDHFGLVDHPTAELLVTPERRDEILEQQREQARSDARETTEKLEADE